MTSKMQHGTRRNWFSVIRLRTATAALALAAVLVPGFVASPSADAPTLKALHEFTGSPDGSEPVAGLARDSAGNLYGTTPQGGASNVGTVFKLDTAGTETVLYGFTGEPDGANPAAGLIRDASGNLYGTTVEGGDTACSNPYGCGTVFKLDTAGNETVLYSFTGEPDGQFPYAGLVRDSAGNLYGTTLFGGDASCGNPFGGGGCGTVFKLDTAGTETVLYSFTGDPDAANPYADLVIDSAGNLYGVTYYGGDGTACSLGGFGCGTVFKLDKAGKETVLHSFGVGTDGANPYAGLVRDSGGNLYGTTTDGGVYGLGIVFKVDAAGTETVLHSFTGEPDGANPAAGLVMDAASTLYGTTAYGGAYGYGTVFKLTTTREERLLHTFLGEYDGRYPSAGLVRDSMGNLYGTTSAGGSANDGVVFEVTH